MRRAWAILAARKGLAKMEVDAVRTMAHMPAPESGVSNFWADTPVADEIFQRVREQELYAARIGEAKVTDGAASIGLAGSATGDHGRTYLREASWIFCEP